MIEVLVAALNAPDDLDQRLRLQTNAVIANQCGKDEVEIRARKDKIVQILSTDTKGVGLNRNIALDNASGDIVIISDDDLTFHDGYADIVERAYKELPDADFIIFDLDGPRPDYHCHKITRIRWYNSLRWGAQRFTFKLDRINDNNIRFNTHFGGGCDYRHGEDTIFIADCRRAGLKIYAYPAELATIDDEHESTWDHTIDDIYIRDHGILYREVSPKWWKFLCIQDCVRHKSKYPYGVFKTCKMMIDGGKNSPLRKDS